MSDRINQHQAQQDKNEAAVNLLNEANNQPKSWADLSNDQKREHRNLLPKATPDSIRERLDINNKGCELPGLELKGFGIVVGIGGGTKGMEEIAKHAKERAEEMMDKIQHVKPAINNKRDFSQGSEGSLVNGGTFQIPKENQVTDEMIEQFKKAKPVPMPHFDLGDTPNNINPESGLGTIQKPKN